MTGRGTDAEKTKKTQPKTARCGGVVEPLEGAILRQFVCCGKPNCRCARGRLHGPYTYRYWRDADGRAHKHYVRPEELPRVEGAILEYRRLNVPVYRVLGEVKILAKLITAVELSRGKVDWAEVARLAEQLPPAMIPRHMLSLLR